MDRPLRVVVEGWRWILHSYGIVNQYHLLELGRMPGIELYHRDEPYLGARWRELRGLMSPAEEAMIARVGPPPPGLVPDVTLRISVPHDLMPARAGATLAFLTADAGHIPKVVIRDERPLDEAQREGPLYFLTPSNWSKAGIVRSGGAPESVFVVPHGVDPRRFRPASPERRAELRARLGWTGKFVFLNLGAMTANKGIGLICRAVSRLALDFPELTMFFKGADHTYRSSQIFGEALAELPPEDRARLASRTLYSGSTLGFDDVAELYQAADAYVAPYASEGFNMPVLEAAACGLPVICSAGGPTDDFVIDDFAKRIRSQVVTTPALQYLSVDFGDLVSCMAAAMSDGAWRERARLAGPRWVHEHYTWAKVTETLVEVLGTVAAAAREWEPVARRA